MPSPSKQLGASLAEVLVGVPVLLLLGLGVLQAGLLLHARNALNHASFEAARAAAVGHAQEFALEAGLARGLAPWLYRPTSAIEMELKVVQAQAHLALGKASGWFQLNILSPTAESFQDWAVPARDSLGYPLAGIAEIPNDNLRTLALLASPTTREAARVQGMAVGQASQQTLLDANVFKLQGYYGVPVTVPLLGPLVVKALQMMHSCSQQTNQRLGALQFKPAATSATTAAWKCAYFAAGRVPIELAATVRMQSAARRSDLTENLAFSPSLAPTLGPGIVSAAETATVQPVRPSPPTDRPEWGRTLPSLPSVQIGVGGGEGGGTGSGQGSLVDGGGGDGC